MFQNKLQEQDLIAQEAYKISLADYLNKQSPTLSTSQVSPNKLIDKIIGTEMNSPINRQSASEMGIFQIN